jgi:hypothetical protein
MKPQDRYGRQGGRIVDFDEGPTIDEIRQAAGQDWPTAEPEPEPEPEPQMFEIT